jgi:triacylglycerol esterase/lipase EstA (alpha/beta hydrolase family)
MGGLAARAWLRACQADDRVHHVITIGAPHQGTWLGRFSPSTNAQQMSLHSNWIRQLEKDEPAQRSQRFTCYYSNCDNIVFPTSVATLPGADNRLVPGVPHVALAFDRRVMNEALALVQ